MTAVVYLAIYLGLLLFIIGCINRGVQYSRMPLHLRWELYPVPHEEPSRAAHGGSYFESSDWWTKPSHFNLAGELKVMVPEMLFLKGLWEFNRRLWYTSFLFHFGLYCSIGTAALVLIRSALIAVAPSVAGGVVGETLGHVYRLTGPIGAAMVLLGALGLLARRLSDEKMREYTTAADIFNLFFFIVSFALLTAGYALQPPAHGLTGLVRGLATFDTSPPVGAMLATGLVLTSILVAYIPFTHMSHFIAKFFTYHSVRWDDRPNFRGGPLEKKIAEYLTYRPTWSAGHIGGDGTKTWAEIATTNPAQEVKK